MAFVDSEKIKIMWRLTSDSFAEANRKNFVGIPTPRKLGTSITAVNNIIQNDEELKILMPQILGLSPNNANWDKRVRDYWDSISIDIFPDGKELEIGFSYDLTDSSRKKAIAELKAENKTITDNVQLKNFVKGKDKEGKPNVPDNEKYKYAQPLVPLDWLIYRFCEGINGRGYKAVANRDSNVDEITSVDVRFYFYDETVIKKRKEEQHAVSKKALKKYLDIVSKGEIIDDVLILFGENIDKLDDLGKDQALKNFADSQPSKFISIVDDENLLLKAQIEKYITNGILKRIAATSIIIDGRDPSVVIGNTMDEAVTFFSPKNTATTGAVAEYSNKYNAINSKK